MVSRTKNSNIGFCGFLPLLENFVEWCSARVDNLVDFSKYLDGQVIEILLPRIESGCWYPCTLVIIPKCSLCMSFCT